MFKLKMTCKDCPFLCGSTTNTTLADERIEEIKEALLQDHSFSCHKTVDYENGSKEKEQHCAGAMIWLYKQGRPNQIMRIAERIGRLNREELKCTGKIID